MSSENRINPEEQERLARRSQQEQLAEELAENLANEWEVIHRRLVSKGFSREEGLDLLGKYILASNLSVTVDGIEFFCGGIEDDE